MTAFGQCAHFMWFSIPTGIFSEGGALPAGAPLSGLICFNAGKLSGILAALPPLAAALLPPGTLGGGDIKLTVAAGLSRVLSRLLQVFELILDQPVNQPEIFWLFS